MNTKKNILFWLSVITIALFSIIVSFYSTNSAITNTISLPFFQLTFMERVIDKIGDYEFFSGLTRRGHHHHHHHHHHHRRCKVTCDESMWKNSQLVSQYGVLLVLTVDQKGCGNFSSLQQAVDAVPDSSSSPTIIILDSGSYR